MLALKSGIFRLVMKVCKMDDYYKILQLKRDAVQADIKKAYRRLAKQYHPDTNHGDKKAEEIFKKINEAYDTLSDEGKKAAYDTKMFAGEETRTSGGNTDQSKQTYRPAPNMTAADFSGSNNIFEDFFGFDPKSNSPELKRKNDKIKPMKTNEAFEAIFGKRRF